MNYRFDPSYRKHVPNSKVHIVGGGHFALNTTADVIANLVKGLMAPTHG
jgi:hypothetical protein